MTTIVSLPFKDGVAVLSDTRATTYDFKEYVSYNKVSEDLGYSLDQDVGVWVAGAGASTGIETLFYPFLQYFERKCSEYCVDLNDLKLNQFIELFNNLSATYFRTVITSAELFLSEYCMFLLIVRTRKFLTVLKTSCPVGGLCLNVNPLGEPTSEDVPNSLFSGVGSGCSYILGALLLENEKERPLYDWGEEEVLNWAKGYFQKVITLDLGSNTKNGLNVLFIYKNRKECKKYRI